VTSSHFNLHEKKNVNKNILMKINIKSSNMNHDKKFRISRSSVKNYVVFLSIFLSSGIFVEEIEDEKGAPRGVTSLLH
jgi:hypothetical protein